MRRTGTGAEQVSQQFDSVAQTEGSNQCREVSRLTHGSVPAMNGTGHRLSSMISCEMPIRFQHGGGGGRYGSCGELCLTPNPSSCNHPACFDSAPTVQRE